MSFIRRLPPSIFLTMALVSASVFSKTTAAVPTAESIAKLPPSVSRTVDFPKDVQPILETACVKCHGRGKANGGWKLDTRESFLLPGDSGIAALSGDSARSHLIHLVAGTDPDDIMPKKGSRLTPEQVGILRAWIDQGLPWDASVTFSRPPANNLKPRKPALPAGSGNHPIDRFLEVYETVHRLSPPKVVDDSTFVRRVHLDVTGLLPTREEQERFASDSRPDKRTHLVRELLADNHRYAQNWLTFWNDLLRNDYKGTGFIDGGRKQISGWLYAALRDNKPYDRIVRELVNPDESSEGFSKGIVWRGTVNASMTPPMQAAQNIGQALMGVNLKCASCHDSFIDDWQLTEAYGLAGIYAEKPLEMVLCDKPTGKLAPLRFLFPELGSIDASASRSNRLAQLADIITRRENGRLPRTLVNRFWAHLLGRGLVEPVDVMQNTAWNHDILDWLAEDLVENQWNIKRTLEIILTSRAYQLPSVNLPEKPEPDFVFRGPAIRRLTAEQFRDALGSLTGVWHDKIEGGLDRLVVHPGNAKPLPVDPFWIWSTPHAADSAAPSTNWFRKTLVLAEVPADATLFVHADNQAKIHVNGTPSRGVDSTDWSQPGIHDLRRILKPGTNIIAIEAVNTGGEPNPAGLLVYGRFRTKTGKEETVLDFGSDASWHVRTNHSATWREEGERLDSGGWTAASVLGQVDRAPWQVGTTLAASVAGPNVFGTVRASLAGSDPLTRALGRPNREQITTQRPSLATTLQALELTNGETLAQLLRRGADKLLAAYPDSRTLTDHVFRQALGRAPTPTEINLATELVGNQPVREGVEDLLWSVAMLPEFQLSY